MYKLTFTNDKNELVTRSFGSRIVMRHFVLQHKLVQYEIDYINLRQLK